MPDLDLCATTGPLRVFKLLHSAWPVLLSFGGPGGEPGSFDITPWASRVQLIHAKYDGPWELPGLGAVSAPSAVLIFGPTDTWSGWETDPQQEATR